MKNYEKYADEIKNWDREDRLCDEFIEPIILKQFGKNCDGTSCGLCNLLKILWLLEDYEEPKEPEIDWSKVEVDTPILVRDSEDSRWIKRYFAKYENETIYAWDSGCTSWSAYGLTAWVFAKLAESEDE